MTKIVAVLGDITQQHVDAIVNAANRSLIGGGGVDGAIHEAAGPELIEASRKLAPCLVGQAKITPGFRLPAKYVIHTVGPIYGTENGREPELLASCYRESLKLAQANGVRTIAFPAISTGVFGYPKPEAAAIAVETVRSFLEGNQSFDEVRFICHSSDDLNLYQELLS